MKKIVFLLVSTLGLLLFFVYRTPTPQKTCKALEKITNTCGGSFTDSDKEQCISQFTELKKEQKEHYKMVSKILVKCAKKDVCQEVEECVVDHIGQNLSKLLK